MADGKYEIPSMRLLNLLNKQSVMNVIVTLVDCGERSCRSFATSYP